MAAGRDQRLSGERGSGVRPERSQHDWIWGRNAVLEALRAGRDIREIWIAEGIRPGALDELRRLAEARRVSVQTVDRSRLDSVTDRHQGVLARAAAFRYADVDTILERAAERREAPLILIADGLQDPQNLGTLIRTLEAVGGHGLIVARRRAVGITPGVVKASAGALQHLAVAQVANIPRTIDDLRDRGVWVAGLDGAGSARLADLPAADPLAFVVGNEAEGLHRLTRERCDLVVALPMSGRVASLNAAVAGSIALYDVFRRRSPA
ncbi:MAG TPA: 23S rRNA (guanosine(2251)-2'-O)-methyltransferase RlmB [Dehalococcoidia bacterium]|nr:23S rRNA (guanosine(2251)-2'-O)-methyltransferase RlmB [Dehalococcoidia bacterium]